MLSMAGDALLIMLDPMRLAILTGAVLIGLAIGVIPGLGGIVGMALLIPFTYSMDPYAAFAFLLGMAAVTTTSDTIPAVLFGVPGTTGSAATVLDGHPLAKKGQAGRAFGAGYAASLLGGVFGALLLAVSIPVLRPIMLHVGSPELLALTVFGLSMVAVLSGNTPLRGVGAAAIGLMVAMIGGDPQAGELRWTFDSLYMWDGLPLVPVTLGLFALPELVDMAIKRRSIAEEAPENQTVSGQWQGIRDVFTHWWLMLRCSLLGAGLGAIPGIGSAVLDWVAYGHAARSEKNTEGFGKGDIRGVIASESSNNAKSGGALVPTIAFGVPGSASMALLLGAFLMHGLVPGPEMLTTNLDVTYVIIWSLALANILGAGICLFASNFLARIALVRFGVLLPMVLAVVFIGAFQGTRSWGDLFTLMVFGTIGWIMKRFGWPRPPLILGFVLGGIFERYLFISVERWGAGWLLNPGVIAIFAVALWGMYRPMQRALANSGARLSGLKLSQFRIDLSSLFTAVVLAIVVGALLMTFEWQEISARVPRIAGLVALIAVAGSLIGQVLASPADAQTDGQETAVDLASNTDDLPRPLFIRRVASIFGWLALFMAMIWAVGFVPAILMFVGAYMVLEGKERWQLAMPLSLATAGFCWFVFDRLLSLPWPRSLIGDLIPPLRAATGLL